MAVFQAGSSPSLRTPQRLTWRRLYCQFGTDPAKASDKFIVRNFRQNVLRELKKIKLAWPELNYTTAPGVLILHPSRAAIPPADQVQPHTIEGSGEQAIFRFDGADETGYEIPATEGDNLVSVTVYAEPVPVAVVIGGIERFREREESRPIQSARKPGC